MSRKLFMLQVFGLMLIVLLLAGCSEADATPTSVPPTATRIPSPQPGAVFSGLMEISTSGMGSNVTADGGEIEFTVSEDGTAIASTTYILINAVCTNEQKNPRVEGAWASSVKSFPPPPIENGKFEFEASEGILIKGNFTSETEAKGTIEISTIEANGMLTCDFGIWNWSAVAK